MSDNTNLECSFCGKKRDLVKKLIAGPNVFICDECITLSYNIVTNETEDPEIAPVDLPSPPEIFEFLNDHIVGHKQTKEMLSVSAYNHYKRVYNNPGDLEVDKSNILLTGSTGTGKTLFAKTLAKKLGVPFAIADATTLTEAGYVGEDVESVLERLLSLANYDLELAQKGIVYIDEIDKKARRSESNTATRDVSGEGVQQALLRLIEGTVVKIKVSNNKKSMVEDYVEFDTANVLFIVGGAFVGIDKVIKKRLKSKNNIGFGANIVSDAENFVQFLEHKDVIEYGLIPEFVSRLPIIAVLDKLDKTHLYSIIKNVKNNVLDQVKYILSIDDINIEFSDEYINSVAEQAIDMNIGARGIRSIVDNSLINLMYRAPNLREEGVVTILMNKYPDNDYNPDLEYEDGNIISDTKYKLYRGINEK
jgi:ATP-dependent Clp protease ATP-binding subunit ClpX